MTDIATSSIPTMSKLKKPTPIKSGIPKLVTSTPSASPPGTSTPTKPSRLPVSRPLSRSISSSSASPSHHHDATNPPNTPVTPASGRTPVKRVAQSMGRPSTPDTSRTSRIPSKLPPTPTSSTPNKAAFKISSKAAEITNRLSTPSHSRAQSMSVDHLDPATSRVTPSRVPTSKLVRPSTAGSSRIGMGRPVSQSVATSVASSVSNSVAGTAHSSPKQAERRTINQRAKQSPPDVLDLDAILASAQAAQQAAKEVNEQERDLSTQQSLSPRAQTLHQRKKSEKLVVDHTQFEPNSPGLLDLDNFDTFDDTDFDSPARPAQPVQQPVPAIQQPVFDDADGLAEDVASQQTNQSENLFEDEDIDFDDSNDNNLVEAPVKPVQEYKEAEEEQPSYFTQPIVHSSFMGQSARAVVGSPSRDFEEKEQEPDVKSSKYELEVVESRTEEPVTQPSEPADEIELDDEPSFDAPVVAEAPVAQPVAESEHDLLDDDLSAFDHEEPLEFDDDFFEASPRAATQSVVQPVIIVEPVAVDSEHLPSATPPTRTPNVTVVEQPHDMHVEQRSEPWSLMGRTDDINEICFEDEDSSPMIKIETVAAGHLAVDSDHVVTRTPAPSTVEPSVQSSALFAGPRTPAPSTIDAPTQNQAVVIETMEQSVPSTLAPFDNMHVQPSSHQFDSSIETRAPSSTAWSAPQPVAQEEEKVAAPIAEVRPTAAEEAEQLDAGLDLSFDDDMSLPVSPAHAAAATQPEVQAFSQSVSSVKDYVASEVEASKTAAAKLRAVEESRRAELDRQIASQAAVAAAALKERQEAERAEAERIEAEEAEEAEYQRQQAEQEEYERQERERYEQEMNQQAQTEYEDNTAALSESNDINVEPALLEKWSEGVSVTKLGRNGKTRATQIFLNESDSHPLGLAWASKSKKPAEARMVLSDCRCVVGAEDGLFVHRKFASKFDGNSSMCVSLIAPSRSLDFIFNSEEDLVSFVTLMKSLNVRVANRVPASP